MLPSCVENCLHQIFVQLGRRKCSSSDGTSDVLPRYKTPRGQDGRNSQDQEGVSGQGKVETKWLKFRLRNFKKGTILKYMFMKKTTNRPFFNRTGSPKIHKLFIYFIVVISVRCSKILIFDKLCEVLAIYRVPFFIPSWQNSRQHWSSSRFCILAIFVGSSLVGEPCNRA